ncbi:toprim domain-containing protein [Formosa algae]|uniref:DNA primase n=1 Tax=Formosa algae TaxID=225843 RepID=A0A9X1CB05_9FLAO|nr:toprim domain-containing protein [Formosa algae]MBP1838639.1 DNA primase [Formosa algae]MDQ0335139.1 DNA primase [Formosa algae]
MNDIDNLRNIPMFQILKRLNIEAIERKKEQYWFKAKWRNESTASVKCEGNLYYDFGEGCGGNTIDFIMKYFSVDFVQAINWLRGEDFIFSFDPPIPKKSKQTNYSIKKVTELSSPTILNSIMERRINLEFAKRFCCQVHYSFNRGKELYSLGFMNNSGGFEVNFPKKYCLGKKEITTISNDFNVVSLFESWSDFLSYLTLKKHIPKENFIILNSTSLVKKVIDLLNDYSIIKLFLDNDEAGNIATNILTENFQNKVIDNRIHYKNYNDLNDYLMKTNT